MKIIPFGKLTDILPPEEVIFDPISGWFDLQKYMYNKYPALEDEKFSVAVNLSIKDKTKDFPIAEDDEIFLMPPFSGG